MPDEVIFYTVDDIAKMLKVEPESVRRWIRNGKLQAVRLGGKYLRVDKKDFDNFILQQKTAKTS